MGLAIFIPQHLKRDMLSLHLSVHGCEASRVFWRLLLVRRSYDDEQDDEQVFT